ncbi:MAG TPA: hypothetical protein VFS16_16950 [Acidimicrobiia bacterium]|nr:hypothetical protein [Acidimicrobiia bacterium]
MPCSSRCRCWSRCPPPPPGPRTRRNPPPPRPGRSRSRRPRPLRPPKPGGRAAVDFWESVPTPTALLIPVVLGLAVLIGLVLGPGGRPTPAIAREGGLSRALARRSRADEDGLRTPAARP